MIAIGTKANLKLSVILGYVLIGINVISGIVLLPLITGSLGQSGYGVYTAASSLVSMFLIDLGLGSAATRFISKYRVTNTQKDVNVLINVIWKCFFLITGIICVVFVIFYFLIDFLYRSFTPVEIGQFRVIYIMAAICSAFCFPFNVISGILVAYDKAYLNKTAEIVSKLLFIAATISCIVLDLGLYPMAACFLIHSLLSVLLKMIFGWQYTKSSFFVKVDKNTFKSTLKSIMTYSIWTSISTYSRTLMLSFMTTILGITSQESEGTAQISIYGIAYQIETYVSYFSTTFGTIFYPEVSRRLYRGGNLSKENIENFNEFNARISHIQAMILVIVCVGLATCGNEFLQIWLTGDLAQSHEAIYFCVLAICSTAAFLYPMQVLETAFNTSGYIKYQCLANLIGSAVAIVLAFPFSYYFGALGCCISIALGTMIRIVLLCIFGRRFLQFKIGKYFLKTYPRFVIPVVLSAGVGILLNYLFPNPSWITFVGKVLLISVVYGLSIIIFGLNEYEKGKFLQFYKRIGSFFKNLIDNVVK